MVAVSSKLKARVDDSDIPRWTATFSLTADITTVGAVRVTDGDDNGQQGEMSSRVNELTIRAPSSGFCVAGQPGNAVGLFSGTFVTIGMVSGLMEDFAVLCVR